jgi:SHS2 domain-containing protein
MDARPETRATRTGTGHELVDHTSEIVVRLWAQDFPGLIQEATRAFADLVPPSLSREPSSELRRVDLDGQDRTAILVDWLNEMVYLAEAELWLAVEAQAEERPGGLSVRARGDLLSAPFVLVKAATLHAATVDERPTGLVAEVTLDI